MLRTAFAAALVSCTVFAAVQTLARPAAPACAVVVFAPAGTWKPAILHGGPGLVLSGGGLAEMPDGVVLRWMQRHASVRNAVRAGNLLILKASGKRIYSDDFYKMANFASVQEVLIPPCASRERVDAVAPRVSRSDFVLFAGGDQAHYAAWKGSKLIAAARGVYARGGIVGGGSAGLAIQGQVVFDSVAADRVLPDDEDVQTADAVKDPYERAISFTTNYFEWPPLRDAITDTHFARRNRFGRLAAFMARVLRDRLVDGPRVYGVAVDEGSALLVDARGMATLVQRPREDDGYVPLGAYILAGGQAARIVPGAPLRYTVSVTHLRVPGETYDLVHKRRGGRPYEVTVDGSSSPMYSRNPYESRGRRP